RSRGKPSWRRCTSTSTHEALRGGASAWGDILPTPARGDQRCSSVFLVRATQRFSWHMRAAPECILQLLVLSSRRLERCHMPIDVTLAIYRAELPAGQTTVTVVRTLAGFGGRLVSWA